MEVIILMRKVSKVSDLIGMELENNVISTIEEQLNTNIILIVLWKN